MLPTGARCVPYRIEVIQNQTTLQLLALRLQVLGRARGGDAPEVRAAEQAVARDPEMSSVVGELKRRFVARQEARRANALLTFHGTRAGSVENILEAGLQPYRREDRGFFGLGCYTTTSLEYAARSALGLRRQ